MKLQPRRFNRGAPLGMSIGTRGMQKNFESRSIRADDKSSDPLFSVVTVVLNGSNELEKTILSVINQSFRSFEYIIVDGGSEDGTLTLLKKYDSCIDYWVSEADTGIYNAMNKGLSFATGMWAIFINAGDLFSDTNILEKVAIEISELPTNVSLVYGRLNLVDSAGHFVGEIAIPPAKALRQMAYKFAIPHQASFTKTKTINEAGGFDESFKIAGDYDLALRLLAKSDAYFIKNLTVAFMLTGGLSADPKHSLLVLREERKAQKKRGREWPHIFWVLAFARASLGRLLRFTIGDDYISNMFSSMRKRLFFTSRFLRRFKYFKRNERV